MLPAPERRIPAVDLSFLQDPTLFQELSTEDIPDTFLNAQNQPPLGTSIAELLQNGHFRRAAETARENLLQCPPNDANQIYELLYARLACLALISRADLASHEAATLTDFLARSPPGAEDIIPLIPWEVRLLLVRLQSIAAADGGRRGIMALYALTAEVRTHVQDTKGGGDGTELTRWSERLRDLGLRVADTLVEMGELESAARHLDTLGDVNQDELAYRKALLRLRVGDVLGAQRYIKNFKDSTQKASMETLLKAATGDFSDALNEWQRLGEEHPGHALFASNLAVGLLYTGNIVRAREVFEDLAQQSATFPGLLFNLGTVYELCTERALEKKMTLAQQIAAKAPAPETGGWERANFEFKL